MSNADVPFRRPWRRLYLIAIAVLALALIAVGYTVASAIRPLPTEIPLRPGGPGDVTFDWNTRGLVWRRWERPQPLQTDLVPVNVGFEYSRIDLVIFTAGAADHVNDGGQLRFPYRYWGIPADGIGWLGGVGILVSATITAYAHRVRTRGLDGRCEHCGYDLRASPGRCPECGATPV